VNSAKAIDRYISSRVEDPSGSKTKVDPRLGEIIESIFKRCIDDGEYKQAIGIALEARRLDVIKYIYEQTKDTSLLTYTMDAVIDGNVSLTVRDQVLHFILPLYPSIDANVRSPHVHALTRLLVTLGDASLTAPLLTSLVQKNKLLAYQFAFDLVEGGAQDFLETLRNGLPTEGVSCKSASSLSRC
jgi:26S proteasome regulatory subunit N2